MSSDVLKQLVEILSVSKHLLQIDKSTLSDKKSLPLEYERFINNMLAQEKMIFAISLPAGPRATTVFNAVEKFFVEKEIPILIAMCNRRCCDNGWEASRIHRINEKENTWTHCNSLRHPPAAFGRP